MKTARRWNAGRVLRDYQSMTDNDPTEVEGTDLEPRDVRALTEYMTVLEDLGDARGADGLYVVVSQSGSEYLVDHAGGACECPDDTYGDDDHACKHRRRVAFATGAEAIPAWVDLEAVDDQLGAHVDGAEDARRAAAPGVATDGGRLAWDDVADADGDGYTEHVEPPAQGGARYVRCAGCGRELLVSLGGREKLPHVDGCPNDHGG